MALRRPCVECGRITASKYRLCPEHNPHKRARPVTETAAWCNRGRHMVEHDGFAKNQDTCRECRRVHYNDISNYSQGKTCAVCGRRVANTNRGGHCRLHHSESVKRWHELNPSKYINAHGYVVIRSQWSHPNRQKNGALLEHTKVMADVLGRPIRPGENVHHINGIRTDNRPENLELWVRSQPSGQRPVDLVCWAKEILELYGDEVERDVS